MEVKPGYKQTEVGVVPENWEIKKFLDLCILQRGFDITEETKKKGNIPVISSSGLTYYHNEAKVKPPGVVTGRKGMLGNVYYLENPFWPHDTTLWVKDFRGNYPLYVYYFLISFKLQRFDAATSVPTLNRNNLSGEIVATPPLPEQTAIATALSDVDVLISGLDRLIEKKWAIKQAAMQELLTGKRRLPGFDSGKGYKQTEVGEIPEDWEILRLGDNSVSFTGGTPLTSNQNYYGSDYYWITSSDLNKFHIHSVNGMISQAGLEKSSAKTVKKGTLLIALYGATAGVTAITHIDATINQAILAIIPNNFDTTYLFNYFHFRKKWILGTFVQGGQPNLSGEIIRSLMIPHPPLPEQTAIATVLSDMDAEISALETRRAKTLSLKQGMMQELLTGRIRLV